MKKEKFVTTVTRAGAHFPDTALKTYIPAEVVKALKIKHGTRLLWQIEDHKASVTPLTKKREVVAVEGLPNSD